MAKFPCITTPTLGELLERIPGWQEMPPGKAIAAVGKAEADDLIKQYIAAVAADTALSS